MSTKTYTSMKTWVNVIKMTEDEVILIARLLIINNFELWLWSETHNLTCAAICDD